MKTGINNPKGYAGKIYGMLKKGRKWMSVTDISQESGCPCVSTFISDIRRQLPDNEMIEGQRRNRHYCYRIVKC